MKIVALLGSPRPTGYSSTLARRFLETSAELGAQTQIHELNRLQYRGCQGCYACKTTRETCILQDDLEPVLEAVLGTDLLLLASPVYYGDVSAQLKGFIDRSFSFLRPDYTSNAQPSRLPPGKKLVFVLTQGHPDPGMFADVFLRYQNFLKWMGFEDIRLVRGCGLGANPPVKLPESLLKQTGETARAMMKEASHG